MREEQTNGQDTPYLSTGEAAKLLGISARAVSQNIIRGRFPAIRVGRYWIIPRDALMEIAKTYAKGPGPQWKKRRRERNTT